MLRKDFLEGWKKREKLPSPVTCHNYCHEELILGGFGVLYFEFSHKFENILKILGTSPLASNGREMVGFEVLDRQIHS